VRQPFLRFQPSDWITYHSFLLLELDGGVLYILCERKTDLLEMVIGETGIPLECMKAIRASGAGRNPHECFEGPRVELPVAVSVREFLEWIDGPVEENWQPYDMLSTNCQHFVGLVKTFLLDPVIASERCGTDLQEASSTLQETREFVHSKVCSNWRNLKYASDRFRQDKELVLDAISQDGRVLRYAHDKLRANREVVLAAVSQDGSALPFAEGGLRQDRAVVLAAVRQKGRMLCYASALYRTDREIVLAAVRQDAYALRWISGCLQYDPEVTLAAYLQNPISAFRASLML